MARGGPTIARAWYQVPPKALELAEMTDGQLLSRFVRDEGGGPASSRAFEVLVDRHGPMVLAACRKWTGGGHDADDAFQATFFVLARKAGLIRRPALLARWLRGVAVHTARRTRALTQRRRQHESWGGRTCEHAIGDPGRLDLWFARREEAEVLHEEIARLPEIYRLPVVHCYLGGLTHAEGAARLGWPVGSVNVRLMRARHILRLRLTRRGFAPALGLLAMPALGPVTPLKEQVEATVHGALRFRVASFTVRETTATPIRVASEVLRGLMLRKLAATALATALVSTTLAMLLTRVGDSKDGQGPRLSRAARGPERTNDLVRNSGVSDRPRVEDEVSKRVAATVPAHAVGDGFELPATAEEPPAESLLAYRERAGRILRDAKAHVQLALWCEAHGLPVERLKHLAQAVLIDPSDAAARRLIGQVAYEGRWCSPGEVAGLVREDSRLTSARAEYVKRRGRIKDSAEGHWQLALWCEREGLDFEARAHCVAVTRRDPRREAAWRRLGYQPYRGGWMRADEIATQKAALEIRKKADRYWKPLLTKWRSALRDDDRRNRAEASLAGLTDPLAVPAIWAVLARGGPEDQTLATRLLSQIDGPAASRALALLAVLAETPELRRIATESLARRDSRDVIGLLINLLEEPTRYEVHPVGGPGTPGALVVETDSFIVRRLYSLPQLPESTFRRLIDPTTPPRLLLPDPVAAELGPDMARMITSGFAATMPGRNLWFARGNLIEAARATYAAQERQLEDAWAIEAGNRAIQEANRRVETPLRVLTGQDFGLSRESWKAWWIDRQGYAQPSLGRTKKPTVDIAMPVPLIPNFRRDIVMHSCFAAGTIVLTREGARSIESVMIGDTVLSQDPVTATLDYAPVVAVLHNPPAATLRIIFDGEPIVVTGIHRFWIAGRGWVMARDLKRGDPVRTPSGICRVSAVADDRIQPVFNLEVGEKHSFFVGRAEALVHDSSVVEPVPQPFDKLADFVEGADAVAR